jgi:hypothetical protein
LPVGLGSVGRMRRPLSTLSHTTYLPYYATGCLASYKYPPRYTNFLLGMRLVSKSCKALDGISSADAHHRVPAPTIRDATGALERSMHCLQPGGEVRAGALGWIKREAAVGYFTAVKAGRTQRKANPEGSAGVYKNKGWLTSPTILLISPSGPRKFPRHLDHDPCPGRLGHSAYRPAALPPSLIFLIAP